MNWLLAGLLLVNLAVLGCFVAAGVYIRRQIQTVQAFVSPSENPDGSPGPSPLAQISEAVSHQLARSMMDQAKTTFMGVQSGAARRQKAAESQIMDEGIASVSPMAASILQSFPGLKSTLLKNPALMDLVLQKLMGGLGNSGTPGGAPNNGHDPNYIVK